MSFQINSDRPQAVYCSLNGFNNYSTRVFEHETCEFELVTRGLVLVTRRFELQTCRFAD